MRRPSRSPERLAHHEGYGTPAHFHERLERRLHAERGDRRHQAPARNVRCGVRRDLQSVSPTMRATGRQPTSTSDLNDVFMPSAAIAVTRHQRETSDAASVAVFGNKPKLFSATSAAKPRRNVGTSGPAPARPVLLERATTTAMVKTTGNSMVTRRSFT